MTEIEENHLRFDSEQNKALVASLEALSNHHEDYLESYTRLIPFQAWKEYVLAGLFDVSSLSIFIEAQNDAVVSHLLARQGMWRPSLQSLRSCVENVMLSHYFYDHKVELRLWQLGKFKIGFSSLLEYFTSHPDFRDVSKDENGLSLIEQEYAELSKAVHGSSKQFMMTKGAEVPTVWVADKKQIGMWATRQRKTLQALNLILVTYHKEKLAGTAHSFLRTSLASLFTKNIKSRLKSLHNIRVPS